MGVGTQCRPLTEKEELDIGEQADVLRQLLFISRHRLGLPEADVLLGPVGPRRHVKVPLECHEQGIVGQPASVLLHKSRHRLLVPLPATFHGLFQQGQTVEVQRTVIHPAGVGTPVWGRKLLLGEETILRQHIQINEVGIAGVGGKALVGGVAVAGGTHGEDLPPPLSRRSQKVHKSSRLLAQRPDPVGGGQGGYGK